MCKDIEISTWRQQTGRQCGVVVKNHFGEIAGWMDELRNPEHWKPGCIAIDEQGREYTATGGNCQKGAAHWKPITKNLKGELSRVEGLAGKDLNINLL